MLKTLSRHGNSYALVIERSILDLLNIKLDTQLDVTTDGQSLTITPRIQHPSKDELKAHAAKSIQKHAVVYETLSK